MIRSKFEIRCGRAPHVKNCLRELCSENLGQIEKFSKENFRESLKTSE